MRFALELGPDIWLKRGGVHATTELVRRAEQAGFDSVWASEDPDGWDAFGVLGHLAASTERIALGTGVTNPYLRHPNLISASIATLDRASGGRAFLGLGRGEPDWYRTAFGMKIGSPLKRVEETVSLLHKWWSDDQIASNEGEIPVNAWRREFRPLGSPPIYIAATGPKMQALAGSIADGMRLNTLASQSFIEDAIENSFAARRQAGKPREGFRIFAHPSLTITESDAATEAALERKKATIALIHVLPGMDRQLHGLEIEFPIEEILANVRRVMKTDEVLARGGSFADLRRAGDLATARKLIPTELVARVAIVGQLHEIKPRIQAYAAAGVTDVFVDPDQLTDPDLLAELSAR